MLEVKRNITFFFVLFLFSFTSTISGKSVESIKSCPTGTDIVLQAGKTAVIVSIGLFFSAAAIGLCNPKCTSETDRNPEPVRKDHIAILTVFGFAGVVKGCRETKELYSMVKTYLEKE